MSLSETERRSARRFAYGLLGFCFLVGLVGRGLVETFTVFLLPLQQEFGWDRATVTAVYSLMMLTAGLAAPLAGLLFDRVGPRALYLGGIAALAVSLWAAAAAAAIWHFHLAIGLGLGLGSVALGNVPNAALLSRWFRARLAGAMAVVYSAMGTGTLLLVPAAQTLIEAVGWRNAYRGLALLTMALLVPLALVPWRRAVAGHPVLQAEAAEAAAAGQMARPWTVLAAARTSAFWGLFAVFAFTANGMFAFAPQVVAFLVDAGFAPLAAAGAYGAVGLLTPAGMLAFGWADQRIGRQPSVALSYSLSLAAIGFLWLVGRHPSPILLALFVLCLGATFGSRGPLVAAMVARIFRGPSLGGILGSIILGGGIGGAVGTFVGGWLHDATGGYDATLVYAFCSLLVGAAPFWSIKTLARA
jgi:MFS family permease